MKRILIIGVAAVGCWVAGASAAHAQVFVRAPFVRVQVGPGGGVSVRVPFVNLYVPSGPVYYPPGYVVPPAYVVPAPQFVPPTPTPEKMPLPSVVPNPPAKNPNDLAPPVPSQPIQLPTLEQFAKGFQPKAGSYEIELINPVTNLPTKVRFTLPEGTPKSVNVRKNEIEFRYGVLHFVRIEFDKDGALVVSR